MRAKSRFAQFLKTYGDAVKAQREKRSAADTEVASFNWIKGAAIDGAVRSDGGDQAVPRILEAFHEHFGDDATVQHGRLCFNAYRAFPTEESRVGRCWTACAVLLAPVKRLLVKEGDETPTPEAVASYARTHFLESAELDTVAKLKAAVKQRLGERPVTRKTRVTITKARATVREFLRTAKPREADVFKSFLVETLKAMEAAASAPAPAPAPTREDAHANGASTSDPTHQPQRA